MNQTQYYDIMLAYAQECINRDEEEPETWTWEVRDNAVDPTTEQVYEFSSSLFVGNFDLHDGELYADNTEEDYIADSAIDYDICLFIRLLQNELLTNPTNHNERPYPNSLYQYQTQRKVMQH